MCVGCCFGKTAMIGSDFGLRFQNRTEPNRTAKSIFGQKEVWMNDESYGPVPRKEEVGEGWLTLGL
ncbi:hypothetical protein MTR_2g038290 [Medicago truncatula]|uniref:Uncharacterized protein n=1 Tax=Medicago truncatula TaxID=3880 RepID=G7IGB6_MEDTR|nr:hypothetical protein MTR_2g038290 [Medicago truncatula]